MGQDQNIKSFKVWFIENMGIKTQMIYYLFDHFGYQLYNENNFMIIAF